MVRSPKEAPATASPAPPSYRDHAGATPADSRPGPTPPAPELPGRGLLRTRPPRPGNRATVPRQAQEIDLGPRRTLPRWAFSPPSSPLLPAATLPVPGGYLKVQRLPAMVMFKYVAREKLKLLWFMFLMGNVIRVFPANPTSNCGMDVYQRVILTLDFQVLATLAAAVLLLVVWMAVSAAEYNAVTVLRSAVRAAESNAVATTRAIYAGAKAFEAYREVANVAVEGVGCIAAKWRRVLLRGMLLLAVALSAAASLLAVVALEDAYAYKIGCNASYGAGSPLGVLVMVLMVLVHGSSAWTAMLEN